MQSPPNANDRTAPGIIVIRFIINASLLVFIGMMIVNIIKHPLIKRSRAYSDENKYIGLLIILVVLATLIAFAFWRFKSNLNLKPKPALTFLDDGSQVREMTTRTVSQYSK